MIWNWVTAQSELLNRHFFLLTGNISQVFAFKLSTKLIGAKNTILLPFISYL